MGVRKQKWTHLYYQWWREGTINRHWTFIVLGYWTTMGMELVWVGGCINNPPLSPLNRLLLTRFDSRPLTPLKINRDEEISLTLKSLYIKWFNSSTATTNAIQWERALLSAEKVHNKMYFCLRSRRRRRVRGKELGTCICWWPPLNNNKLFGPGANLFYEFHSYKIFLKI